MSGSEAARFCAFAIFGGSAFAIFGRSIFSMRSETRFKKSLKSSTILEYSWKKNFLNLFFVPICGYNNDCFYTYILYSWNIIAIVVSIAIHKII